VVAAPLDDPAAVGMLVEAARAMIFSPVPPAVGVDLLFYEPGSATPADALFVRDICPESAAAPACDPARLAGAGVRLLNQLRTREPAAAP
jgi:hypothetical protein